MIKRFTTIGFLLFFVHNIIQAQFCQGSLGDPIVNITFGSGSNPGPALPAATTNYQYITTDCPNDGFYTVRNNSSSCFSSTWHNLTTDHTGDGNGYFMLVNASFQPGAFYIDTVRGLCGNTTYEFAAWVTNVIVRSACNSNSILPNLTFSIEKTDGTVIQSTTTGGIATEATIIWKQFGLFFTTPAGVNDIVLRIVNNAPGGCGNDIALDDITFRPCGPSLSPSIVGIGADTVTVCQGTATSYTFNCTVSGGYNNPEFQWQQSTNNSAWTDIAGQNTTTLVRSFPAATPAGIYQYRLAAAETGNISSLRCRITSKPVTVNIITIPATTAGNNGPACIGRNVTLSATGATQYNWTGPNGYTATGASVQITNIQSFNAGKYYVLVTNAGGCVTTDSTTIVVNPSPAAATSFTNTTICVGDSIQLLGSGGPSYAWIPAAGLSDATINNPMASPAVTTTYKLVVTNAFGCTDTASTTVIVAAEPVVSAGPDKSTFQGKSVQLSGSVTGQGTTFSWTPPTNINDIFSLTPLVNPLADTYYVLTAKSANGCKTISDTVYVKIFKAIYIPNAFTPNGDGLNDTWNIPALTSYPDFELLVFNRYGELIFRTNKTPVAWDGICNGKPCTAGAYPYVIKTGSNDEVINGTVLIIR